MASFDAGCCHDMNVVFFKPRMPEGQYNSLNSAYGDNAILGIDAGCCHDMKVVFFKPKMPEGQYISMKSSHGVTDIPGIEVGFYMDLSARAIDAVESMKK